MLDAHYLLNHLFVKSGHTISRCSFGQSACLSSINTCLICKLMFILLRELSYAYPVPSLYRTSPGPNCGHNSLFCYKYCCLSFFWRKLISCGIYFSILSGLLVYKNSNSAFFTVTIVRASILSLQQVMTSLIYHL